jgi:hypothetical protein
VSTRETREWRPLIFLAVLTFHFAIVWFVIRAARSPLPPSTPSNEPLVFLLLSHKPRTPEDVSISQTTIQLQLAKSKSRASRPGSLSSNPRTIPPELPKIDWEKETELAGHNAIANAEKQDGYRNLSALSPEQLSWVRQNHLEPAKPGIPWKYRRVEIAEGGFPIVHINDHCIAIPFLLMMVFCEIGHIEPNGGLFKRMRDPRNP